MFSQMETRDGLLVFSPCCEGLYWCQWGPETLAGGVREGLSNAPLCPRHLARQHDPSRPGHEPATGRSLMWKVKGSRLAPWALRWGGRTRVWGSEGPVIPLVCEQTASVGLRWDLNPGLQPTKLPASQAFPLRLLVPPPLEGHPSPLSRSHPKSRPHILHLAECMQLVLHKCWPS